MPCRISIENALHRSRRTVAGLLVLLVLLGSRSLAASAADRLSPLEPGNLKLGGEIGRRIDVTVENNLLVINVQRDFLQPFADRKSTSGYVGLGKLIDSLVHMAAHTGDPRPAWNRQADSYDQRRASSQRARVLCPRACSTTHAGSTTVGVPKSLARRHRSMSS